MLYFQEYSGVCASLLCFHVSLFYHDSFASFFPPPLGMLYFQEYSGFTALSGSMFIIGVCVSGWRHLLAAPASIACPDAHAPPMPRTWR